MNVPLQEIELQQLLGRYLGGKTSEAALTGSTEALEEFGEREFFVAASPKCARCACKRGFSRISMCQCPSSARAVPERNRGSPHPHVIIATAIQFLKVNCTRVAEEVISSYPVLTGPDPHLFALTSAGNLRELEKIVYLQIQA